MRAIKLLILASFMIVLIGTNAVAAVDVALQGDDSVALETSFNITINFSGTDNVKASKIVVGFEPSMVEVTSVTARTGASASSDMTKVNTDGSLAVSYADANGFTPDNEPVFATISLQSKTSEGDTSFTVDETESYVSVGFPPTTATGTITNKTVPIGGGTEQYTVTFEAGAGGTLTSEGQTNNTFQYTVDAGNTTKSVTAVADNMYDFSKWTKADGSDYATTERITVTPTVDGMELAANFVAETFAVNSISDTSATEGAEITVSGSGFDDTTNVLFAAKDETTTAATSVEYTDSNTLVATVPDLSGKEGPFSIIVEKGGNQVPLEGTSFSYVSTFPVGDADESGTVDIFDALTVALYAAGVIDDTQINLSVSDVSCTGNTTERPVNTNDALAIAEHDVGIDGKTVNDLTLCTQ